MFRKIFEKITGRKQEEYPNRFLKFYYLNKERLNKERRSSYKTKQHEGFCVRCAKKAVPGIVFCSYHQEKQKSYNKKARSKK